jgi:acyl dehydratase
VSGRYFEDFRVGEKFTTKNGVLSEDEIVAFARIYDPQFFHTDSAAAKNSIYGGLIASGFQTLAFGFRLVWDTGLLKDSSMGSPGFDALRWLKPVRPGDRLHVEMEVAELRPSRSKPDRGIMRADYKYVNQNGEAVLSYSAIHLLRRRPA